MNSKENKYKIKIKEIETELNNVKNKNKNLIFQINILSKYNKDKDIIIKENKKNILELIDRIRTLENILNNNSNGNEIIKLKNEIKLKEKEIEQIKSRYPFELENNEKLMTIIFTSVDQSVLYSFICKNTDKFSKLENLLYNIYPEKRNPRNYFFSKGNRIDSTKTLEENKIKNSDVIILNIYENSSYTFSEK